MVRGLNPFRVVWRGGRFTPTERSWCGHTVKLGCGLVFLSGWDARRREVREQPRQGSVPMSEPTTIKVKDGGFVSVERGPEEKDWIRLGVTTVDRTLGLGVILTSDEAGALGRHLLWLAGDPEPYG